MKNIGIILSLLWAMTGCAQERGFVITCDNLYSSGQVYLIADNQGTPDTLAHTTVTNGKCKLEGKVDKMVIAEFHYQGASICPVFVDNADYRLDMKNVVKPWVPIKVEGGGKDQQLKNKFDDIYARIIPPLRYINDIYAEAQKSNDTTLIASVLEVYNTGVDLAGKEIDLLIIENPDELVSAYMVHRNIGKISDPDLKKMYSLLGEKARNTSYGQEVGAYIQTAIGEVVPDFAVETPEGKSLKLYDLKGKVKIIDFWASWCQPCRATTPRIKGLYRKYHSQGLEVLSVTMDENKKAWKKVIEQDGMNWQNGFAQGAFHSEPARQYMIRSIPYIVILDTDNRVIAKGLTGEEVEKTLEELMQSK